MVLHLVKLCVGIESVEDLQAWIDFTRDEARVAGREFERTHVTRMVPTKRDEILDGGSLYWVIKGQIQVRSRLIDIRPFTDGAGIKRCELVMDPRLIRTETQPRRPFQGWRYLKPEDAPRDAHVVADAPDMPADMRRELAELGLL
ncbi:DUF1489 family protein [Breoghania sp.]|uniref:DUF1489 family protein n=1 Tax=Breoghania sp. TaxID=2065378 RepID=UPI00260A6140|nr:DUF1489 family protein [Breoghania sp.]MDJ0929897.1 DUF1489 family protein [Breoghania sp.]